MAERAINEEMTMTTKTHNSLARSLALGVGAMLAFLLLLWGPTTDSASAKAEIYAYEAKPSNTQAGAHPDLLTYFRIGNRYTQGYPLCGCNDPKDINLHLPAGVIGNPHVVSICDTAEVALNRCSPDSQIGFSMLEIFGNYVMMGLYRTHPQAGQAGLFVFVLPIGQIPQYVSINSRTDTDFGLDFRVLGVTHLLPSDQLGNGVWGVPAAKKNDLLRLNEGELAWCGANPLVPALEGKLVGGCSIENGPNPKQPVPSSLPVRPFLQNPSRCIGPLESSLDVVAYDREITYADSPGPETTGCDQLSFDPSLAAKPTTNQADTASGLSTDLKVPQFQDPEVPSPSQIRQVSIALPDGFTINANAGDGKVSCSDEEAMIGSIEPAECPEHSKIGTVTLESSALPGPIHGYAYLGDPLPGDPYRLILTAFGHGTAVKIPGSVVPDPQTGRLTMTFPNLPQSPFERFLVHIFGSERGLLATPTQCGDYAVETTFTPWADEVSEQKSTQYFTIDSGPNGEPCPPAPRQFAPTFEAGSADNTAGNHTSFALRFVRADGHQSLVNTSIALPPGFLASLKGIPYCPQAAIDQVTNPDASGAAELAASACPAASRLGGVVAGTGAGTRPQYFGGQVFLAGPYKGAPLSVVVVVPAVTGPYDLGNVAVRAALDIDPRTARASIVSDPIPQIIEGVPTRLRSIQVNLDRDRFTLNPTNCDPFSIVNTLTGTEGGVAGPSTLFQVANCAVLDFEPKLALKLSGGLNRRGHPALQAVLNMGSDGANIRRAVVTLPRNEQLDSTNIGTVCTRAQFAGERCPAGSVYGSARVDTPLLDAPLTGPVYLRASGNKLPDLVADLEGQIDIELVGKIDAVKGALRTTFQSVPDAPVSRFVLRMQGGKKGLLQNERSVCGLRQRALVKFVGQNGKKLNRRAKLKAACGSKKQSKRSKRRAKAVR